MLVSIALMVAVVTATAADDKSSKQYWYQVTISYPTSEGKYTFAGISSLGEDALLSVLTKGEFIKLDECLYRDKSGNYKSWSEWDPMAVPRFYINSKYILTVQPLVGDPRKIDTDAKDKRQK